MVSPSLFRSVPLMNPRTLWACQPVLVMSSWSVAPSSRWRSGEPSGVEDRVRVVLDHLRDRYHLEDREIELVQVLLQCSIEWNLLSIRDLFFAVFVPVRDELGLEFVRFGQELLELQAEAPWTRRTSRLSVAGTRL
jgi:hypothetical protein